MNEFLKYINIIKDLVDNDYEKERIFYNDGEWYDREESRNISLDELEVIVKNISTNNYNNSEIIYAMIEKLGRLVPEDDLESFLEEVGYYE